MDGTITDDIIIDGKTVAILAGPGARLTGTNDVVKLYGNARVSIIDLEITGVKRVGRNEGSGIAMQPGNTATLFLDRVVFNDNGAYGVRAEAGTVNIDRSTFSNNLAGVFASGGGILNISESTFLDNKVGVEALSYTGSLNITRSAFSQNLTGVFVQGGTLTLSRSTVRNGSDSGVYIGPGTISFYIANNFVVGNNNTGLIVSAAGNGSKIEYNTIVDNRAKGSESGGIHCNGKVDSPNNLIFGNTGGPGVEQINDGCVAGNSLLATPDNPGFLSPLDYHLTASSPPSIVNVVDCSGIQDFDGESRQGKCDLGADEYKAP